MAKCKCNKAPHYGFDGKATHCAECKVIGMTRTSDMCVLCKKVRAHYGLNGKDTHCKGCATSDMIRITDMCNRCNATRSVKKLKHLCTTCFCEMYPTEKFSRRVKAKELRVVAELRTTIFTEFPDIISTFDKRIDGGCSSRRPDIYSKCSSYDVIIEIDENQHIGYTTTCEEARINNIFNDSGLPIWMIRFNPDAYIDSDGVKHKSMFTFNDKGDISVVQTEAYRFKILIDTVRLVFTNPPPSSDLITTIQLFYGRNST